MLKPRLFFRLFLDVEKKIGMEQTLKWLDQHQVPNAA
jgi:hypothetical protein